MVRGPHGATRMEPPCIKTGEKLNPCAARLYQEKVLGHVDLSADWAGWRLRGRILISPDGDRINPERLRGILFRESGDARVRKAQARLNGPGLLVAIRSGLPGGGVRLLDERREDEETTST